MIKDKLQKALNKAWRQEQKNHANWAMEHLEEWLAICLKDKLTEDEYLKIAEMLIAHKLYDFYLVLITRHEKIGTPHHERIMRAMSGNIKSEHNLKENEDSDS